MDRFAVRLHFVIEGAIGFFTCTLSQLILSRSLSSSLARASVLAPLLHRLTAFNAMCRVVMAFVLSCVEVIVLFGVSAVKRAFMCG